MSEFTLYHHMDDLDQESKYLIHKAKDATTHAYAPYSKFLVGAALILDDGTIVTGTNQENAAYPSGMCAERVALFSAISQHPDKKVRKMVVVAKRKSEKELLPATSCGPCRQVMLEFESRQNQHFEVIMLSQDHQWVKATSAKSLLPFSFTAASLEHVKE
jgi:cytidine deaminase